MPPERTLRDIQLTRLSDFQLQFMLSSMEWVLGEGTFKDPKKEQEAIDTVALLNQTLEDRGLTFDFLLDEEKGWQLN